MKLLLVIAIIGLFISFYAKYVENRKKNNFDYRPFCDFSNTISCSAVLTSKYNKILKFQNTALGVLFYLIIIVFILVQKDVFIFIASILAALFSFYLAYIQFFKLRKLCFVCTLSHIINLSLVIFSYFKL